MITLEPLEFREKPTEKVEYLYSNDISRLIASSPNPQALIDGIKRAEMASGTVTQYRKELHENHAKNVEMYNKSQLDKKILQGK